MASPPTSGRRPDDDPRVTRLLEIKPKLLRMLAARGVPEEIAEELFQDAFLIYWESDVQPQRLRRWFTGVLHHLALDWFRRRQRRARVFTQDAAHRPGFITRPPRIDVEGLLEGLDLTNRNLLTALYIEGRDVSELAKQFKTTPSTIRKRASRARLALRKKFTPAPSHNRPPDRLNK